MYLAFILLVASTIWIGLLAFFWALDNGQFSDQNRARYLPLTDEIQEGPAELPVWRGRERYLFLCMGALLVVVCGAAVILSVSSG
jgi:cbb3-type cytochrome oxidase maturation protein